MGIYKKLHKIQEQILALAKDKSTGSHNGAYKYVTGDKILSYIKPLMNEYGILLKQEAVKVEKEEIHYTVRSGEKVEILYSIWQQFTWVDIETGETDVNQFFASGMNSWEKGVGSAFTYAERYFLLKFFHIATDEDDIDNSDRKTKDGDNTNKDTNKKTNTETEIKGTTSKKMATKKMIDSITIKLNQLEYTSTQIEEVFKWAKIKKLNDLTADGAKKLATLLNKKIEELQKK